ncbi:MAG: hypothetical protein R6V54_12370 [Desulfobacteraceae bacterium]
MEDNSIKAAFMGKVTASVSHELQNVLAIISENQALMDDLLAMDHSQTKDQLAENFSKSLDTISRQVLRGKTRTSELNTFAHTPDRVQAEIPVVETVSALISITRRITALLEIDVKMADDQQEQMVETDPLLFQAAVFSCIEWLSAIARPKTVLTILVYTRENKTAVQITGTSASDTLPFTETLSDQTCETSPLGEHSCLLCQKIHAQIKVLASGSGIEMVHG